MLLKLFRLLICLTAGYALAVLALTFIYLLIPPVSAVMMESALTGHGMKRDWVDMNHIAPAMRMAAVASEDGRFCEHGGIDWEAVDNAIEENERSSHLHGASTITMQVAKNLFLWNGRSWLRKALEAPLALWIDLVWPKRRILEVYLNIAQWGDGEFGVELAARRAFGKHASALSPREAALLATALPDPVRRNAARPGPYQSGLADIVERRMQQVTTACTRHRF